MAQEREVRGREQMVAEAAAAATGVVAWPLFAATYVFEKQLKPVETPAELAALASLIVYAAIKANKER